MKNKLGTAADALTSEFATLAIPSTHSAASTAGTPTPVVQAAPAGSVAEQAASYFKQWTFDAGESHTLVSIPNFVEKSSNTYNLKNSRVRKFLQWENQSVGINIGWTNDAEPSTAAKVSRWFMTKETSQNTPVHYGDKIAMGYGIAPSYIKYGQRTWGINMVWSTAPAYEWEILGGPRGQEVRSGDWVAIYNTRNKQPLIHFNQTVGGDIGWPTSQTWTDATLSFLKDHWQEGVAFLLAL